MTRYAGDKDSIEFTALPSQRRRSNNNSPTPMDDGHTRLATAGESVSILWNESKLNYLLPFMLVAFGLKAAGAADLWIFVTALLALIPLANSLGFVTEELAKSTNETLGGLLNATFGNATELIISSFALMKGMNRLVQVSLLGSIISNLLLVLGSAMLLGGVRFKQQSFNTVRRCNAIHVPSCD
jgi:Ca2+:H+ antiporter